MTVPKEVKNIIDKLKKSGFEAYIVGGCVRDFLLGIEPKDWDVTTNAKPEEIQRVFLHPPKFSNGKFGRTSSFYENDFYTVTVLTESKNPELQEIEVTTYRLEAKYSDKRHPDELKFAKTLEEDLARRDFTVNAIALEIKKSRINKFALRHKNHSLTNPTAVKNVRPVKDIKIIDIFNGRDDLKNKIIKTVGNPEERFGEDALRMLRAVRFATTLDFKIEEKTAEAIKKNSVWLSAISKERIRDEFLKIIMAYKAADGVELLRKLGLLKYIIPELEENYGVGQNKHHIYDCYQHALKALEYAAKKKFNVNVRLASLFHDIAKPRVKVGEGINSTFYNHEVVGAKMAFQILNRLKFSKKDVEKVVRLIQYHMFYYNVGEVSESSVRRLVKNVGPENMPELLQLREADRIGSGVPKAEPYKLRHLKYIIEKVSKDPISVKMLKVNGKDVMDILEVKPGPKIGQILDALLGYVLDDPKKNTKEFLEKEIEKLGKLNEKELKNLAEKSKEEKFEVQTEQDEATKKKYWVK